MLGVDPSTIDEATIAAIIQQLASIYRLLSISCMQKKLALYSPQTTLTVQIVLIFGCDAYLASGVPNSFTSLVLS